MQYCRPAGLQIHLLFIVGENKNCIKKKRDLEKQTSTEDLQDYRESEIPACFISHLVISTGANNSAEKAENTVVSPKL